MSEPRAAARPAAGGRPAPAFSKSEMMIVAAARELAGQRVCFVGVGLPNIAVNLARLTVAPALELVYESGAFGAKPARLPLSIGDPTIVTGATAPSRCSSCSASTCRAGWWTSGSSAPPRSTASATSTAP
jgi:glutaconate CoA-transferase subunit B